MREWETFPLPQQSLFIDNRLRRFTRLLTTIEMVQDTLDQLPRPWYRVAWNTAEGERCEQECGPRVIAAMKRIAAGLYVDLRDAGAERLARAAFQDRQSHPLEAPEIDDF